MVIIIIIIITLHYRHFKCHLHIKWPVVHQQLHVIRNTAHRPSTQASYTASRVRPKRKISCAAAQIAATLTISFPLWRHMSLTSYWGQRMSLTSYPGQSLLTFIYKMFRVRCLPFKSKIPEYYLFCLQTKQFHVLPHTISPSFPSSALNLQPAIFVFLQTNTHSFTFFYSRCSNHLNLPCLTV